MSAGKTCFVFPGQGSQYVGMGLDLYENYPEAKAVFDQAEEILGVKLTELMFNGPEEELKLTINTQPAILTVSAAILRLLAQEGIQPDYTCGHSLGEYSALIAAGALETAQAISLVRKRGFFMQEAVPPGEGGMAAIMGLSLEETREVCLAAGGPGQAEPANYNSPSQIVISGKRTAVEKAVALAKEKGGKGLMLSVTGPFHSSLLEPAALRLAEALHDVEIKQPRLPVIANVNAEPALDAETIRRNLTDQVRSAVLWQQSIEKLLALGTTRFVEIGPGKVLTGLIKKIDKNAEMFNIENKDTLERVLPVLKGA